MNEIATLKLKNCIVHVCDNSILKNEEEINELWQRVSNKAYELIKAGG